MLRFRSRPARKKALYSTYRTYTVRHKSPLVLQRWLLALGLLFAGSAGAQTYTLAFTSDDFVATPVFSDVTTFVRALRSENLFRRVHAL